jgi:hypothetical protein
VERLSSRLRARLFAPSSALPAASNVVRWHAEQHATPNWSGD